MRDPTCQAHELFGQERGVVEELLDGLGGNAVGERIVVQAEDDAHEALAAEGDEDARANGRDEAVHRVGKGLVEGDGKGYVAELGHSF